MPWWSWVLIWTALCLLLVAMLAFFARRLFRALMRVFSELEAVAAMAATSGFEPARPNRADPIHDAQTQEPAMFSPYSEVVKRYLSLHSAATDRRLTRRLLRLDRARMITSLGSTNREWPNVR